MKPIVKLCVFALASVVLSGDYGDDYVRFALIENIDRSRQALRGIKSMFRADGLID